MATVEEVKISGRAYRVWDAVNSIWKRVSYWTKASDVEFDDESNLEDKITSVNGNITQLSSDVNTNYVGKTQLTFTLSGNDLYITKTY